MDKWHYSTDDMSERTRAFEAAIQANHKCAEEAELRVKDLAGENETLHNNVVRLREMLYEWLFLGKSETLIHNTKELLDQTADK